MVVASILLAFGIDAWWGGMQDRASEREYLARLLADHRANQQVVDRQKQNLSRQITHARLVYPVVARGDWAGLDTVSAVVSSYLASPSPTPTWVDDTFAELISTGHFRLIRNTALRADLLEYYRYLESRDFAYELMSTGYRDAIRHRMNPDLQLAIRRDCLRPDLDGCQVEDETWDLPGYVDWLSENPDLAGDLGRVITQWTRAEEEYLPGVITRTEAMIAQIQEELARR